MRHERAHVTFKSICSFAIRVFNYLLYMFMYLFMHLIYVSDKSHKRTFSVLISNNVCAENNRGASCLWAAGGAHVQNIYLIANNINEISLNLIHKYNCSNFCLVNRLACDSNITFTVQKYLKTSIIRKTRAVNVFM